MEWWQTLIISLCSGILTIVATIVGTKIANRFEKKEKKYNQKKETYFKLLYFCNILLLGSSDKCVEAFYEGITLAKLYASTEVKQCFEKVRKCYLENNGEKLNSLIDVMVSQMRCELEVEEQYDVELLSKTLKKSKGNK